MEVCHYRKSAFIYRIQNTKKNRLYIYIQTEPHSKQELNWCGQPWLTFKPSTDCHPLSIIHNHSAFVYIKYKIQNARLYTYTNWATFIKNRSSSMTWPKFVMVGLIFNDRPNFVMVRFIFDDRPNFPPEP
jgi:hypothetical protein